MLQLKTVSRWMMHPGSECGVCGVDTRLKHKIQAEPSPNEVLAMVRFSTASHGRPQSTERKLRR